MIIFFCNTITTYTDNNNSFETDICYSVTQQTTRDNGSLFTGDFPQAYRQWGGIVMDTLNLSTTCCATRRLTSCLKGDKCCHQHHRIAIMWFSWMICGFEGINQRENRVFVIKLCLRQRQLVKTFNIRG